MWKLIFQKMLLFSKFPNESKEWYTAIKGYLEAQLGANKLRKGDLADHEMIQLHEKIKYLIYY